MARNKVELIAKLRDQLSGPLGRTEGKLKRFGRAARTAAMAVGAMAAAVFAAAKKLADYGAAIQDMSDASGIGVESLQGLQYAIEQAGGSSTNLAMALRTQAKFIGYLEQGVSTYTQYLDDLGLTYEQLKGLSPEDAFLTLSEALAGVSDDVKKTEIGMMLFGSRGLQPIMAAMEQFEGGIRGAQGEFEEMGHALSSKQVADLKTYADAMTDLSWRFKGFLADSIVPLLPALEDMADAVMDAAEEGIPKLIDTVKAAIPMMKGLVDVVNLAAEGWSKLTGGDTQEAVDQTAEVFRGLAAALEQDVTRGTLTATEAANQFYRELDNYIESARLTGMENIELRGGLYELEVGFGLTRDALWEFLGILNMTETYTTVAEAAFSSLGGVVTGLLIDTEALTAALSTPPSAPPPPSTGGTGGPSKEEEDAKRLLEIQNQIRDVRRAGDEEAAKRLEQLIEMNRNRYEEEQALIAEAEEMEAARLAQIEAVNEALIGVLADSVDKLGDGLTIMAIEGQNAAEEWANAWLAEIQRLIISSAFKTLLDVLTGGLGGGIMGILGFQGGGEVRHAQGGTVVPDAGTYGDKHIYMLERGERVTSREQRMMEAQEPRRSGGDVRLVYSPMFSTASPGEAVRLARETARLLREGGYI